MKVDDLGWVGDEIEDNPHALHKPDWPWLGRLLAMGMIPLTIQDGSVSIYRMSANP
jgi:hypothetical protein